MLRPRLLSILLRVRSGWRTAKRRTGEKNGCVDPGDAAIATIDD